LRRLKIGDTVRQTLTGYENVDLFMVLDISKETDESYDVIIYSFVGLPGVYHECITKKHVENEFFSNPNSKVVLRTEIL